MLGQQKVSITEQKVPKFIEHNGCYELVSNDGEIKIVLSRVCVMDGDMESTFYTTNTWVREDGGWIKVNNTENYRTKEEFIDKIDESLEFTQALNDYREYIMYKKQP